MASNEAGIERAFSFVKALFPSKYPLTPVKSTVDGRTYNVRDMPDKQEAANLLARLRMRLQKLMDALVAAYPDKPQVQRLKKNFEPNPERFMESTPDADHTSYSVNKGEEVHFCLRQRGGDSEALVPEDVMTFVAIHEMAHMITKSVGHEPEFWNNFGWLLKEAESRGHYKPMNFQAHPVPYCGVMITDSPRYDPKKDNEKNGTDFTIGKLFGGT
jgi:hypothetical protein